MIKYEDLKIVRGPDGKPKFNIDIEETPITLGLKRNISQSLKLYCKCCNIRLDNFVNLTLNQTILSLNFPKQIEKEIDALLEDEQLSLGPPPGYFKRIQQMKKRLQEELSNLESESEDDSAIAGDVFLHANLKLNKKILRVFRIFANYYSDASTEDKRINDFLGEQIISLVQALAANPPKQFPDSLKQRIHKLVDEVE